MAHRSGHCSTKCPVRWLRSPVMGHTTETTSPAPSSNATPMQQSSYHRVPARCRARRLEPTQRDRHLQLIAGHGRMAWQNASGYNRRALVEADISRYKRVIGDALRSHTDCRRPTEVAIAVGVLNRMLELGRQKSVRIM
jgi:hypothetical protein